MIQETFTVWLILVVVAMSVATLIRLLVAVIGRQGRTVAGPTPPAAAQAAAPAPRPVNSAPATAGGHPAAHVAAISAAVAVAFDNAAVVVHIEPAHGSSGWANEGRAAHHGSHSVGRSHR